MAKRGHTRRSVQRSTWPGGPVTFLEIPASAGQEGPAMGRYVDGFVIPVRKDRIEDYRRIAEKAAPI